MHFLVVVGQFGGSQQQLSTREVERGNAAQLEISYIARRYKKRDALFDLRLGY